MRQSKAMQFDAETQERVIEYLLEGKTMLHASREMMLPYQKLVKFKAANASFGARVDFARTEGMHSLVETLDDIVADKDMNPMRARMISETIRWKAGKLNKTFGDRQDINLVATHDIGATLLEARARSLLPATNVQPALAQPAVDAVFTAIPDMRTTDTQSDAVPPSIEPSIFD